MASDVNFGIEMIVLPYTRFKSNSWHFSTNQSTNYSKLQRLLHSQRSKAHHRRTEIIIDVFKICRDGKNLFDGMEIRNWRSRFLRSAYVVYLQVHFHIHVGDSIVKNGFGFLIMNWVLLGFFCLCIFMWVFIRVFWRKPK